MNRLSALAVGLLLASTAAFAEDSDADGASGPGAQLTPEQQQYVAEIQRIWDSLDPKHGEVQLLDGVAKLNVPEEFYFLDVEDTETVLVEVWGNPPGAGETTLGMLFPSGSTPFDKGAWGVTIEYIDDGHVSDENAGEIDYDELLEQMRDDTRRESAEREQQGYDPVELVGWAAQPFYDAQSHKMHWAQEIRFGQQAVNTLNYNIRILGREGVLVLNFIADMSQKTEIDQQIDRVLALAEFEGGHRYQDFDPTIDKVAAYGIGALVAGKVIAKTGLLAAALIFLKKFGVLIVVGASLLIGRIFRRKRTPEQPGDPS